MRVVTSVLRARRTPTIGRVGGDARSSIRSRTRARVPLQRLVRAVGDDKVHRLDIELLQPTGRVFVAELERSSQLLVTMGGQSSSGAAEDPLKSAKERRRERRPLPASAGQALHEPLAQ